MENQELIKDEIKQMIYDDLYVPMNAKELLIYLDLNEGDLRPLENLLKEMASEGWIVLTKKGRVLSPEAQQLHRGVFQGHKKGFGFVNVDNMEEDIFIPASKVNGAMHKDVVFCTIAKGKDSKRRKEGEITKVLIRGMKNVIGTFQSSRNFGFVIPDSDKLSEDIFIPRESTKGAVDGHKVLVQITKSSTAESKPEGKIIEIIGHKNDPGVDVMSIVYELDLPLEFSKEVYEEVEKIPSEVMEKDYEGRLDLRDVQMVTIDGEDAKDLDDAISLEQLENGNYKLGVHIADVTHYVKENSAIDKEALKRGTSVYLVDRVIPMLPHKLSNGICSLNAGVERLALSCIMEIDQKGEVVNHQIANTLINIDKRMSYTMVNDVLTNEDSEIMDENKDFLPLFKNMEILRNILLEKRVNRGAIEFNFPESKVILDEKGKPIEIKEYERNIATSIIEEFMLVCNETVAEEYFWLETPFVFRSHSEPDEEKIEKLKDFIHYFGYYIKGKSNHPKTLQALLINVEDTKEEKIISKIVLRSMKQARYTPTNEGHFGLAAKYYCHFTSPIRRYPDLQIHRLIKENIAGGYKNDRLTLLKKIIPDVCKKCSINERIAEEAERETVKLKKIEFMEDKIGNEYEGIISGVTSWGLYVELLNTVEGMVSTHSINCQYTYDEAHMRYILENGKDGKDVTLGIGEKVIIKVVKADSLNRKLDFELVL